MKELRIGSNDAGQRLDRFLAKAVPLLPASLAQKYIVSSALSATVPVQSVTPV